MSTINERIFQICQFYCGGNFKDMSHKCNIPPSTLRLLAGVDQKTGKNQDPKHDQLIRIFDKFEISDKWFFLGIGSMRTIEPRPLNEVRDTTEIIYKKAGTSDNSEAPAPDATKIKELHEQIAQLQHNIDLLIEQNSRIVQVNQQLTDRLLNPQFPSNSPKLPEGQSVPNT